MIVIVYGTRPEAIKLGPIANELRNLQVPFKIIATGQHDHLLKGTPADFDLQPDSRLTWPFPSPPGIQILGDLLGKDDLVVVQGDTSSAYLAAYAGHWYGAGVAHVEAGIRSGDLGNPYPEEGYRREISRLATHHFAPTWHCVENLAKEGITRNVYMTGNPVVSALHRYATARADAPRNHILMTMHRREFLNRGQDHISALWKAVQDWTDGELGVKVIWPIHPSLREFVATKTVYRNFQPCAPLSYKDTQKLLRTAVGVITDSGGLVEEAVTLGIPVAILRVVHDRPEAETCGLGKRFDPTPEGFRLAAEWLRVAPQTRLPNATFGHPWAASSIARHLRTIVRTSGFVRSCETPSER